MSKRLREQDLGVRAAVRIEAHAKVGSSHFCPGNPAKRARVDSDLDLDLDLLEAAKILASGMFTSEVSEARPLLGMKRRPARYGNSATEELKLQGAGTFAEEDHKQQNGEQIEESQEELDHTTAHTEKKRFMEKLKEKSFEEGIQQLKAFKEMHGHVRVTDNVNKNLATFCVDLRAARLQANKVHKMTITEESIKALNELGFEWNPRQQRAQPSLTNAFKERIEQLKAFKTAHGHIRVTDSCDKKLATFCSNMRKARRKPGMIVSEERIKALDDLGFEWVSKHYTTRSSFEERIEQLTAFKEAHGHCRVSEKVDKNLATFCMHIRTARRDPEKRGVLISEEKIKALDELGFEWNAQQRGLSSEPQVFGERIEQLKAYKRVHGHVRVTSSHDKTLASFCNDMRQARREPGTGMAITEETTKALSDLGFEWGLQRAPQQQSKRTSFEECIEQMKAFKEARGHVNVTDKVDKNLAAFCSNMRKARRNLGTSSGGSISEDRIRALDDLGFQWDAKQYTKTKSFEERIEQLEAFKEARGHVRVTDKVDKNLATFCRNMRQAHRNPGTGIKISEERIKALDDLGFEWKPGKNRWD